MICTMCHFENHYYKRRKYILIVECTTVDVLAEEERLYHLRTEAGTIVSNKRFEFVTNDKNLWNSSSCSKGIQNRANVKQYN